MVKTLLIALLLIVPAFASRAREGGQVKAPQIFEAQAFSETEVRDFLGRYPELATLDVASKIVVPEADESFTLTLFAEKTNDVYVIHKGAGQTEIEKSFVPFGVSRKTFEGEIRGSLFETLMDDIKNEKIARQMSEAFREDFVTTRGLKVGASYSFDVIEYFFEGRPVKFGDVVKATLLVGKAVSEKILTQDLDTLTWALVPVIPEPSDRPFYAPVKMSRVSSLFNLARKHPVKRRIQPHNGIDFVAPSGTPVFPALEGTIIAMGRAKAKGKFVLIEHDNGYQTTYDHLRKFAKGLRPGARVELSDQLGEVGRTGYATGAHLHFGVLKNGLYVNPLYLVKEYTFHQKDLYETETADAEVEAEEAAAE